MDTIMEKFIGLERHTAYDAELCKLLCANVHMEIQCRRCNASCLANGGLPVWRVVIVGTEPRRISLLFCIGVLIVVVIEEGLYPFSGCSLLQVFGHLDCRASSLPPLGRGFQETGHLRAHTPSAEHRAAVLLHPAGAVMSHKPESCSKVQVSRVARSQDGMDFNRWCPFVTAVSVAAVVATAA